MKNIIQENGETLINSYTINCIPFGATPLLGKLYISDKALYYDAQYDMSVKGVLDQVVTSAVAASGHALLVSHKIVEQWESKGFIHIPKSEIKSVTAKKSLLKKKVIVELNDDQSIVFDYGMLSVNKLENDIKA